MGQGQEGVAKPQALLPGDRIAVVAPSAAVDASQLEVGVEVLRRRGFRVDVRLPRSPYRFFSGSDEERRIQLLAAFADPDVRAVWCARGGYGMSRLLPGIDPSWLSLHPKLVIGFSDATALLLHLALRARVAALHGPMIAHDVSREDETGGLDHLLDIAAGGSSWRVEVPAGIRAGEASGPLLGGCLSVLAALVGTPYAPRFTDAIALLEDVGEHPQRRIDRLLVQLRQSGALTGVRGVVFGTMPGCGQPVDLVETITDCLGDLDVPIGFCAPVGHGTRNYAVPFGVRARLRIERAGSGAGSCDGAGVLEGLEPAVQRR